jgi:hypothetical protein
MGYNIRISRAADEPGIESPGIFLKEWLSYVNSDKELELATSFEIRIGAETQFQNRPGDRSQCKTMVCLLEGKYRYKEPRYSHHSKNVADCHGIKSQVQGDDGEIYDEKYLLKLENTEKQKIVPSPVLENKRPWWKFW